MVLVVRRDRASDLTWTSVDSEMLSNMWTLEGVTVKEEPDTLTDFSTDQTGGYTDLQTVVPISLPPLLQQDFPSITISELTSPDSSSYSVGNITTSMEGSFAQSRGRKRSNSGSSGSSANSASCGGQPRPSKVRRRQPLSEEELNKARSEGEVTGDQPVVY